jgi:hypothetical protein
VARASLCWLARARPCALSALLGPGQGGPDSRRPLRSRASPGLATSLGDPRQAGRHWHGGSHLLRPRPLPDCPDHQPPGNARRRARHVPLQQVPRRRVATLPAARRSVAPPLPPAWSATRVHHRALLRLPQSEPSHRAPADAGAPGGLPSPRPSYGAPPPPGTSDATARPGGRPTLPAMRGATRLPGASIACQKRTVVMTARGDRPRRLGPWRHGARHGGLDHGAIA